MALLVQHHAAEALVSLAMLLLFATMAAFDVSKFAFKAGSLEASAETRPAKENLEAAIQSAAIPGATAVTGPPPRETRGGSSPDPLRDADELRSRAMAQARPPLDRVAIETVVKAAAHWGWTQAKVDIFSDEPVPHVSWDQEGRPSILYGSVVRGGTIANEGETVG